MKSGVINRPTLRFGITQKALRDGAFGGRERGDQSLDGLGGKLFEQRRAVVGRHLVEDAHRLFAAHAVQEFLLFLGVEVFEDGCRLLLGHHAEDDDLVFLGQIGDHVGEVGGHPFGEEFTQLREIACGDEALDLGLEQLAKHGVGKANFFGMAVRSSPGGPRFAADRYRGSKK